MTHQTSWLESKIYVICNKIKLVGVRFEKEPKSLTVLLLVAQCISSSLCFVNHASALAFQAGVTSFAPHFSSHDDQTLCSFDSASMSVQVNPAWQRSGLGRGLVERLTARLVNEDITIVSLYAEPNVVGLYNRLGFVANPDGIKGMAFQKTSKPGKALVEQAAATAAAAA